MASVYGVRETLAELRQLDKRAQLACVREMKSAAKPLANKVAAYIPHTAPLSGFDHLGRTGWNRAEIWDVKIKYGGRRRKNKDEWALVSLRIESAPGMIFDMAGRKSNNLLASKLSARFGSASRAAWRPAEELFRESAKAITQALEEAVKETNENLVYKPGTGF
jgi:hypothetical protein